MCSNVLYLILSLQTFLNVQLKNRFQWLFADLKENRWLAKSALKIKDQNLSLKSVSSLISLNVSFLQETATKQF